MVRVPFTPDTRDGLINHYQEQGLILVEEQYLEDGDYLIFDEPDSLSLEARIQALETAVLTLLFSGGDS